MRGRRNVERLRDIERRHAAPYELSHDEGLGGLQSLGQLRRDLTGTSFKLGTGAGRPLPLAGEFALRNQEEERGARRSPRVVASKEPGMGMALPAARHVRHERHARRWTFFSDGWTFFSDGLAVELYCNTGSEQNKYS